MENTIQNKGILYLIPSSLGSSDIDNILPPYNKEIINTLNEFIAEDARTARRFLKSAGYALSLDNITFHLLNEHTQSIDKSTFLNSVRHGGNIGLLSEAGCPCIADPGAEIVKIAQAENIRVIPLVGPSSILMGLMASGFNGQNFAFVGYLPIEQKNRMKKLKELETLAIKNNQTQIFIETPYRNQKLLDDILKTCSSETLLCIASDITLQTEFIKTKTISEWKKDLPDIQKKTTVFLIYKGF